MKRIFLFFSILIIPFISSASHIMGGDIAYEYIGDVGGGMYRYKVTYTIYSNCDSQSNWQDGPPGSIRYAVYQEGFDPDADKAFIGQAEVFLSSSTQFTPDIPAGCSATIDVCIYEAKYVTTVDLPITHNGNFSNGYHLYFDVCCRNNIINNLVEPGFTGSSFYAFVPSPLVENSSPVFSDSPLPFLCVGDTTPLLNTAFDPDGDLLVFSFQEPYAGYSSATNPQPIYNDQSNPENDNYFPNLAWPIPTVEWESGFSYTEPFTTSGDANINGFTGYSEYTPPSLGNYVVAVEIKEYRNGNLIGITRRDMQMIVVNCPINNPPELSNIGSSGQTSYTIEEGDNLCFDVVFNDVNGDAIELTSNGDIFDASLTNPTATINTPQSGTGDVTANFCWDTDCGQGRSQPFLFTVNATDDGCLPKTTPDVYSILVNDFEGPTAIQGNTNVCSNQTGEIYSVTNSAGATYMWNIVGGSIVSGQGSNSIIVDWGNSGLGEISVATTSQHGCGSDLVELLINIKENSIDIGTGDLICKGDSITLGGSPTAPNGFSFLWTPSFGLNNNTIANPKASPDSTTKYTLLVYDALGCSLSDSLNVSVSTISVDSSSWLCSGDSLTISAYGSSDITSYSWMPLDSIMNENTTSPIVWPSDTTTYIVTAIDTKGCIIEDSVVINVNTTVPTDAGPDISICPLDSDTLGGRPTAPPGSVFEWNTLSGLNDSTISNPIASVTVTTKFWVKTLNHTCNGIDTVEVIVHDLPSIDIGNDVQICIGDSIELTATGGITYTWSPTDSLLNDTLNPTIVWPNDTTMYYAQGIDNNGCVNSDSILVIVSPLPSLLINGNSSICLGDTSLLVVEGALSYNWFPEYNGNAFNNDSIYVFPITDTAYFVTAIDSNACINIDTFAIKVFDLPNVDIGLDKTMCFGDSVLLTATGANSYSWNPDFNLSSTTNNSTFTSTIIDTTYYVLGVDTNGCINSDSVFVTVNPLPIIVVSEDAEICLNDSTLLVASGGTTYTWDPPTGITDTNAASTYTAPSSDITYIVTGQDVNNCVNTDTVNILVHSLPIINAGNDTTACKNSVLTIGSTPTAPVNSSYQWTPSTWLDSDIIANPTAIPEGSITYYLQVTDSNLCINNDSLMIGIFDINQINDTSLCDNESITLKINTISGNSPYSYTWFPTEGLSNPTAAITTITSSNNISYGVSVSDANGCIETTEFDVIVYDSPNASFNFTVEPHCGGLFTSFSNNSSIAELYKWTFNGNDTSNEFEPNFLFPYAQLQTILLEATNSNGCYDSTIYQSSLGVFSQYVSVTPPSVFSPNNDGVNEVFEFRGDYDIAGCTDIKIFNRWGTLIFSSYGGTGWDGHNFSGVAVKEGVYFYVVDINGMLFKGTLSLMR